MDAKKLKLIVRGDKKPTFGTDPNEPWSVRAGITESERSELHAYLKSRGINPDFVSKDTKISHAKSSEFHKWRRDHQFDDPINFVSTTVADKMKQQRAQTEEVEQMNELAPETLASYVLKTTSKDPKRAEPRKKAMSKLAKIMAKRSFSEEKKPTALEKFRKAADEREKKHAEIEKKQSKDGSGMTAAIDRLEKHLNKEETINEISSSEVRHHFDKWTNSEHAPYNSDAGDDNKVHQSALRYLKTTDVPKEKHEKMAMHIAHKFHGSGIDEEVEQIDELKKSTVFSWLKQQPVVPEKKPGMSRKDHNKKIKTSSKSWNRALDRLAGYKPTSESAGVSKTKETQFHKKLDTLVHNTFGKRKDELKMKEDVYQDSQAATQTAFDMGTQADDREPTYSKRKEMSKSARIIKSLYKKHKMVKEELYDHEKEDKSVATYGKKPKVDKQEVYGDDDTQAAMILKGGTTLTGQTRDTLEIDPVMRKPVRPDNQLNNKKTDK